MMILKICVFDTQYDKFLPYFFISDFNYLFSSFYTNKKDNLKDYLFYLYFFKFVYIFLFDYNKLILFIY